MKKKHKKLLTIVGILLIAVFIIQTLYPEMINKAAASIFNPSQRKEVEEKVLKTLKSADKVLGEKVSIFSKQLSSGEGPIDIEAMVSKIANTETVKEIEQKIEEVVQEKTKKIQKIPEEAIEEVENAAKKEVRKKVCEEWLDSAKQNND